MRKQTWLALALLLALLALWGWVLVQMWDLATRLGLVLGLLMVMVRCSSPG